MAGPAGAWVQAPQQERLITRVHASRHSNCYHNVFSAITPEEEEINSVPPFERNPPCWCDCCTLCPTWCQRACSCCSGQPSAPAADPSLRETMEVDVATQTLLVSSGYTFKECIPLLDAHGLVFIGNPEADTISIGGAVAVGAHGGGRFQTPISGYLLEIWIRDAQGKEHHLRKGDPEFSAATVSLGLLGIITKVRLQCKKPDKNRKVVAQTVGPYSGEGIETATPQTHSFQFAPYLHYMVRYDDSETDQCAPNCPACCYYCIFVVSAIQPALACVEGLVACCPSISCAFSQVFVCPGTCIYPKMRDGSFLPSPALYMYTVEYSFDVSLAGEVFDELAKVVEENTKAGRYITYRFWCRYVGAMDESCALALSAGGDKVAYEFSLSQRQRGADAFIDSVVAVFKRFGGRPHFGKTLRPEDVEHAAQVYGSINGGAPFRAFEEVRRKFDPNGVFLNESLDDFVKRAAAAAGVPKSAAPAQRGCIGRPA